MIKRIREKVAKAKEKPPQANKKLFIAIGAVMCAAALGYYLYASGRVSTDDAFIDGHVYTITPRVPGYVVEVPVEDNQLVEAGQVLLKLDPTDYQVALAQAKADLAAAESQLSGASLSVPLELSQTSSRVEGAEAQLASLLKNLDQIQKEKEAAEELAVQAKAEYDKAGLDLARYSALRQKNVVAQADLDAAQTKSRTTQAATLAARARADAAAHNLLATKAQIDRLKADIALAASGRDAAAIKSKEADARAAMAVLAKERVRQAELNLGYTTIVSPVAGHVTKKRVEPGQMLAAGQPLLAVVPLNHNEQWVTANYKETQLTGVRPGQEVSISIDAYPDLSLKGKVESIQAGSGAVFSLFPPENASGNYVKVVQRIPVKIVFDSGNGKLPELRLGMSVVPTIVLK